MKPLQVKIERFKALAVKRKGGLLEPAEEEEYRRLGRLLAQQKKRDANPVMALRGEPLAGCDFFDDFPECFWLQYGISGGFRCFTQSQSHSLERSLHSGDFWNPFWSFPYTRWSQSFCFALRMARVLHCSA